MPRTLSPPKPRSMPHIQLHLILKATVAHTMCLGSNLNMEGWGTELWEEKPASESLLGSPRVHQLWGVLVVLL